MLIILTRTLISSLKVRKSLINQGFPIKNKHRFYDTDSYHNYGAYLVSIIHPILNSLSSASALEIHFENEFRTLGVISKSKVFRVNIALLRINAKGLMI